MVNGIGHCKLTGMPIKDFFCCSPDIVEVVQCTMAGRDDGRKGLRGEGAVRDIELIRPAAIAVDKKMVRCKFGREVKTIRKDANES